MRWSPGRTLGESDLGFGRVYLDYVYNRSSGLAAYCKKRAALRPGLAWGTARVGPSTGSGQAQRHILQRAAVTILEASINLAYPLWPLERSAP